MIRFLSYATISAFSFAMGIYSVPIPQIILEDHAILSHAQLINVGITAHGKNILIDSNNIKLPQNWKHNDYGVYAKDSEDVAITNNIISGPEPLWDKVKYKFVARPEYYACTIDGVGYKSCDDIPKEKKE